MGDQDFSISTEGLASNGEKIAKESQVIQEALNDIDTARKSLDGWVSENKKLYEDKIAAAMPKMLEMKEVIDSYSTVAIQTANRAEAVERSIASTLS